MRLLERRLGIGRTCKVLGQQKLVVGIEKPLQESEQEFAQALASGAHDAGVGIRVRVLGTLGSQVHQAVASRPEVALLDDVVTASGRVELRYWVKEQAVSMTLHRFGNPSPRFHELAAQLLAPAHLGG